MAGARARARERGEEKLAPPFPLGRCDRPLLESALAAPRAGWGIWQKYGDLPAKTAALLYALAKLQACPEGNKRVALLLVERFVIVNRARLRVQRGELAAMILEIAETEAAAREETIRMLTDWTGARLEEEQ